VSFKRKGKEKKIRLLFFEKKFQVCGPQCIVGELCGHRWDIRINLCCTARTIFLVCCLGSVSKISVTLFLCLVLISLSIIFPNQNFVCLSCVPSVWCSAKLANPENSSVSEIPSASDSFVARFFPRHRCILHAHPIVTIKGVAF